MTTRKAGETPMMDAASIISLLGLEPHPEEGGWFGEIYRAPEAIAAAGLPDRYGDARTTGTAIYYLLTPDTFSAMHRLKSDEIFHFYLGDPVEQVLLFPDGASEIHMIGPDLASGARPVSIVPQGVWQGARLAAGGRFALLGCTVSPGFEYADYEHGDGAALAGQYPAQAEMILAVSTG